MLRLLRGAKSRSPTKRSASATRRPLLRGVIRGRYDAAQTTDENRRHWAGADRLGPDAAANPRVRATLRSRARYEVANNSYARGIVLTLANDTIGTGPRLQMLSDDPQANTVIEQAFMRWCRAVNLPEKLRTMRMARAESGEAFAVFTNNPRIASEVTLDLKLIEPDQVTTPLFSGREPKHSLDRRANDGIVFDAHGNPIEYCILKDHPGEPPGSGPGGAWSPGGAFAWVPAESVIHLFRGDRPGQTRGIPELTPALPLFAQLRRYRLGRVTRTGPSPVLVWRGE